MSDALLDQLRADGEVVERGHFSVDAEAAREKLAKYRLSDPHEYILHVVEAAHLLGADRIDLQIERASVTAEFDGRPLRQHHLENIYEAAFRRIVDDRTRALRHLSIAISSAQRIDPKRIVFRAGTDAEDEETPFLTVDADGETSTETRDIDDHTCRFRLVETLRLSHVRDLIFGGTPVETDIVADRCRFSDVPTLVGHTDITEGFALPDAASWTVEAESDGARIRVGLLPPSEATALDTSGDRRTEGGPLEPSTVAILQNGVEIERRHLACDYGTLRPVALVDTDRLTRNLSQTAFVRDEAFDELVENRLPSLVERTLLECLESTDARAWERYFPWFHQIGMDIYRALDRGELDASDPLVEALVDRPLFPVASDIARDDDSPLVEYNDVPYVSLHRLTDGGDLPPLWSNRRFSGLSPVFDRPVLSIRYVGPELRVEVPEVVYRDGQNVAWELERAEARHRRRLGWQGTLPYSSPPSTTHPFREHDWYDRIECSVYLRRPTETGAGDFDIVVDGHLLTSWKTDDLPLPPFTCVLMGDLEPNDTFDDVIRDDDYAHAVITALDVLFETLLEAARSTLPTDSNWADDSAGPSTEIGDAPLDWTAEFLDAALSGRLIDPFFDAARLPPAQTRETLRRRDRERSDLQSRGLAARIASISPFQSLDERIDRLGDLADIPVFEIITDRRDVEREAITLRQAATLCRESGALPRLQREARPPHPADDAGPPAYTDAPDRWRRAWRSMHRASHVDDPVVITPPDVSLADRLFDDCLEEVEHALADRTRREQFFAHADPLPAIGDAHVRATRISGDGWTAEIGLAPLDNADATDGDIDVYFAHRDTRLDHRHANTPVGQITAVIRGDAIRPAEDWSGLHRDLDPSDWIDRVTEQARRMLVDRCRSVLSRRHASAADTRTAIWRMIRAADGTDWVAPLEQLPAFSTARDAILSTRQLREQTRQFDDIGYVERGRPLLDHLPIDPDAPILLVPRHPDAVDLLKRLVPDANLVDIEATDAAEASVDRARKTFLDKPEVGLTLDQVPRLADLGSPVATRTIATGEIRGEVALLPSDSTGERGTATCAVVHRNRLLSIERFSVPFGRFAAVCTSPTFQPDDVYRSLARGRRRLRRWITVESAMLVGHCCDRLRRVGTDPRPDLRRALLKLAVAADLYPPSTIAWAAAADRLAHCPLLLTSTGRTISTAELVDRTDRGGVSFSIVVFDDRTHTAVLGVSHDRCLFVSARPFDCPADELAAQLSGLVPDATLHNPDRIRSTVEAETGLDPRTLAADGATPDADASPADILARRLERELAILSEDQSLTGRLGDIRHVTFDADADPVAVDPDGTLRIDPDTPVTAYVLDRTDPDDPATDAWLAAVLLTGHRSIDGAPR